MSRTEEQRFIATEPVGKSGEAGEMKVWEAVKQSFQHRECLAYWRYPIFSKIGQSRKEPDILIIDKELGTIVIEVKSLRIQQIQRINGHVWEYQNFYQPKGDPYRQAEDHLYAVTSKFNQQYELRGSVTGRALVALPEITEEEWQRSGFDRLPSCPPIIFKNQLGKAGLMKQIQAAAPVQYGREVTDEQWPLFLSVISGAPVHLKEPREQVGLEGSRSALLAALQESLHEFDSKQEVAGKTIPPGAQRIRGIAGSGKTVLLAQKAAHMHLKHPEWDIALVFFTRSLYDSIESQVDKWLRHFSDGTVSYDETVRRKLRILHTWGGKTREGLYSLLARQHHVRAKRVNDFPGTTYSPGEKFAKACIDLLEKADICPSFDAILIDEGQDLVYGDAFKYEEKQPFYWLAFQALRPVDEQHPYERRLIWAYDEGQSLDSLKVPSAKELFGPGKEFSKIVSGSHLGGIKKSEIMQRCYRTPGPILTAAHAIGMGLLRPDGMLRGLTNRRDWEMIGYEVKKGSFRAGEEIVLHRPGINSPNLIPYHWEGPDPVMQFVTYSTRQEELTELARRIRYNIEVDKLQPSRDILVIVLGNSGEAGALEREVAQSLMKSNIPIYIPSAPARNQTFVRWDEAVPDQFWHDGAVTISRIHRAKGNEASVVYVVGFDQIAKEEQDIQLRNQLFVSLTRARGWAVLSGITGYTSMYTEMQRVIESGDTFTFTFKRPPAFTVNEDEEEYVAN